MISVIKGKCRVADPRLLFIGRAYSEGCRRRVSSVAFLFYSPSSDVAPNISPCSTQEVRNKRHAIGQICLLLISHLFEVSLLQARRLEPMS